MKKSLVTVFFLFIVFTWGFCQANLTNKAITLSNEGNYKDAFDIFQTIVKDKETKEDVTTAINDGVNLLIKLGLQHKIDSFLQEATLVHKNNIHALYTIALCYSNKIPHYGYLVSGKFYRGSRRAGGEYVDSKERDRVQSLMLFKKCLPLLKSLSTEDESQFYLDFAKVISTFNNTNSSWKLQIKTDISTLPSFSKQRFRYSYPENSNNYASVDKSGNPVFFTTPKSFKTALSDGERWMWLLHKASLVNKKQLPHIHYIKAEFLLSQFGVNSIRNTYREKIGLKKEGPFALITLTDNETICQLATGIKRIKLPPNHNFINFYKEIGKVKSDFREKAIDKLSEIYTNRRQYDKAVIWLKKGIQLFGNGTNNTRLNKLKQITDNWGIFLQCKDMARSNNNYLGFRFRNGHKVDISIYPIDMKAFIKDVQKKINSNTTYSEINYISFYNIADQLVNKHKEKYKGKIVKRYSVKLTPANNHFDKETSISIPKLKPGAYLVSAKIANGNTSYISFNINKNILLSKKINKGIMYFIADSQTGFPAKNCKVNFFGYQQDYRNSRNSFENIKFQTKKFSKTTDEFGIIYLTDKDLQKFEWMVYPANLGKNYFLSGLEKFWISNFPADPQKVFKTFIITDRPIYKPGDTVFYTLWIAKPDYSVNSNTLGKHIKTTVTVKDGKYKKIVEKELQTDEFGMITGSFTLKYSATLGNWTISTHYENKNRNMLRGYVNFTVEEYKKPEFKVTVKVPKTVKQLGEKIKVEVESKYYFGKPVEHGKLHYKVFREEISNLPYPICPWDWLYGNGYLFKSLNVAKNFGHNRHFRQFPSGSSKELVAENTVSIGENGINTITVDTFFAKEIFGDKNHRYSIKAEVTDNSRRKVFSSGSFTVSHKSFEVFISLDKNIYKINDKITVNVNVLTANNTPVNGNAKLELYKLNGEHETFLYSQERKTDKTGKVIFKLNADKTGYFKIVCKVKEKEKAVESQTIFRIRGKNQKDNSFKYSDLTLTLDKKIYKPGEKVNLEIDTKKADSFVLTFIRPVNGMYLKPKFISVKKHNATLSIPVTSSDYPNFFVEVLTVKNGTIYTETREILVPPIKKELKIELLSQKKTFKPSETVKLKLKVTDNFDKPVETTLALTAYDLALEYISGGTNVTDIKKYFWSFKRNHSPTTTSPVYYPNYNVVKNKKQTLLNLGIFGFIVEEDNSFTKKAKVQSTASFKSRPTSNINEDFSLATAEIPPIPPDQNSNQYAITLRKNFTDSAYFNGFIETDKQGVATIEFTIPDNLTSWKLRCWGISDGTKTGHTEKEIETFKPLFVRLQKPRFLTEGDNATISVNVHNYLNSAENIKISVNAKGNSLEFDGNTERNIILNPNEEQRLDFKTNAMREGVASITVTAVGQNESDGVKDQLTVQVHGTEKTVALSKFIPKDKSKTTFEINIPEKRKPGTTKLQINISPSLAASMLDALPYLADYPYGCTEQTVNRFVPAVITASVLKNSGISLSELSKGNNLNAQEIGAPDKRKKQWNKLNRFVDEVSLKKMVNKGLAKLETMQNRDGGWGWFYRYGQSSYADTTAIVVRGLLQAKETGFDVKKQMISRGTRFLKSYRKEQLSQLENNNKKEKVYKTSADNLDAFVNNVLTEAGYRSEKMENYLFKDKNKLSLYGKTLVALSMHKLGDFEKRDRLIRNIEQFLEFDRENQTAYLRMNNGGYSWYWYGNEIETHAWYLKLLALSEPNSNKAAWLVKYLLNNRKHGTYWYSTKDTAYCVEAFGDYLKNTQQLKPDMKVKVLFDGKNIFNQKITQNNLFSFNNTINIAKDKLKSGTHKIKIKKKGNSPLYVNSYLQYFSLEDFIEKTGLEVKVERKFYKLIPEKSSVYVADKNNNLYRQSTEKYIRKEIQNHDSVKSGDIIEVELTIKSKNDYEYIVAEDFKPAGFEALSMQSGYDGNSLGAYIEYRNNRVVMFIRRLSRGTHSVSYTVYAETPGIFSALPTKIYGMYAPELQGNSDEFKVEVNDLPSINNLIDETYQ